MIDKKRLIQNIIKSLPKTELHIHLDGSLSSEFIKKQHKLMKIESPPSIVEYLQDNFFNGKDTSCKKNENWRAFDYCNQVLQTQQQISEGIQDVGKQLLENNVKYAEIRFCPSLHQQKGLSLDQVVQAAVEGFSQIPSMKGGIIICALIQFNEEIFEEIINLTQRWIGKGVVGFDTAGDELTYPLKVHEKSIRKVSMLNIPITLHAGDFKNSLQNMETALELSPRRIGHGHQVHLSPQLIEKYIERNILLEVCPVSNEGWGTVESFDKHPLLKLPPFTLCSDNLLITGHKILDASLNTTMYRCMEELGFSIIDIRNSIERGLKARFNQVDQLWEDEFIQELDAKVNAYLNNQKEGF